MDKQLAQMPPGQRDMIMKQMGPQMEMMRKMAAGGGIEVVSNVRDMRCNVPVPNPMTLARSPFGGGTPGMPASMGAAMPVQPSAGATHAPANAEAARQACLQEKVAAAQAAQKKKRGFGKLLNAAARTASRFGNQDLGQIASDVHAAGATADDLAGGARDLGLTEDEIAECDNP
jgi:hypothetical protein